MSATGRNATELAARHPLPVFDERLSFTENTHTYFLDGARLRGGLAGVRQGGAAGNSRRRDA